MQSLRTWLTRNWHFVLLWAAFIVSRAYIFTHPPDYVRYFEEYANIWYYGLPPYLKHWFEYPPATIPFISGPLILDQMGIGKYRLNFRLMILGVDVLVFAILAQVLKKMSLKPLAVLVSLGFYIAITAKAKDFMYENLDLLFATTMLVPAVASILINPTKKWLHSSMQWLWYWFGTGLKLVNAPLAVAYFWATPALSNWKRIAVAGVTAALIWGAPLLIFRSSLSVIIIYHKNRQLQVESIPSLIVRGANLFTKSEEIYFSDYKSFDLRGPISNAMLPLANMALVVAMGLVVLYILKNRDRASNPYFLMKVTLLFIFAYMTTNKVFSTPYHLWYLPLLVIYPYRHQKERLWFFFWAAIFAGVATTRIPSVQVGPFFLDAALPVFAQVPACLILLISVCRLVVPDFGEPTTAPLAPGVAKFLVDPPKPAVAQATRRSRSSRTKKRR